MYIVVEGCIGSVYPYPLSRQKIGVFKVDSSPFVKQFLGSIIDSSDMHE